MPRDPYLWFIDHCFAVLIHRLREVPKDEGIAIFVDKDKHEYETLGQRIAKWHELYAGERRFGVTYGYSIDYKPLQAADILVNEIARYRRSGVPLGVFEQGKNNTFLSLYLYNRRLLEMELELTVSGKMRPDGANPLVTRWC